MIDEISLMHIIPVRGVLNISKEKLNNLNQELKPGPLAL
jgi:hypothetical protein